MKKIRFLYALLVCFYFLSSAYILYYLYSSISDQSSLEFLIQILLVIVFVTFRAVSKFLFSGHIKTHKTLLLNTFFKPIDPDLKHFPDYGLNVELYKKSSLLPELQLHKNENVLFSPLLGCYISEISESDGLSREPLFDKEDRGFTGLFLYGKLPKAIDGTYFLINRTSGQIEANEKKNEEYLKIGNYSAYPNYCMYSSSSKVKEQLPKNLLRDINHLYRLNTRFSLAIIRDELFVTLETDGLHFTPKLFRKNTPKDIERSVGGLRFLFNLYQLFLSEKPSTSCSFNKAFVQDKDKKTELNYLDLKSRLSFVFCLILFIPFFRTTEDAKWVSTHAVVQEAQATEHMFKIKLTYTTNMSDTLTHSGEYPFKDFVVGDMIPLYYDRNNPTTFILGKGSFWSMERQVYGMVFIYIFLFCMCSCIPYRQLKKEMNI